MRRAKLDKFHTCVNPIAPETTTRHVQNVSIFLDFFILQFFNNTVSANKKILPKTYKLLHED